MGMAHELDPQVKAHLTQMRASAALQPAADHALSAKEKIAGLRQRMGSLAALRLPAEPVSRAEDLDISGPAGHIPVRLYVPFTKEPRPNSAPALVYYHGGGFVAGDLDSHDTLLRALANRARCIVVSVAYRLAPENPYPAANDDAYAALKWVFDYAPEIGVDPRRLAVGGDSAGGLLAAWVAQKAKANDLSLRLQVLLYPNLDATMSKPSWTELGTGAYFPRHEQMLEWYDAYLPVGINRQDPNVSPLFAANLDGVAPALIITADRDPLHDEGDEYPAKLKAANVPVDHICWRGMIHGFASMAAVLDAGKTAVDTVAASLRRAFE
jgi:acetyl esterase/lipase